MIDLPRHARRLLAAGLLLAVPQLATAQQALAPGLDPMARRYQLGQGLRLGDSGLALGGYGTLSGGEDPQYDWRAGVDSLSSFLWWDNGARWSFFSELELENAVVARPGEVLTSDAEVELERFYVDYTQNDQLKLRVGKFLTPVGRWNVIHASPLVWTTSRPLITERTFPTNATGAMLHGVLPWTSEGVEYSLYYSPGVELARDSDIDTFKEALGGHLSLTLLRNLQIGLSYVDFEQESLPDHHRNLYGVDFAWTRHRWELSGEFFYRAANGAPDGSDEKGFYLQGVAPLTQRLYAVTRYEQFHRSDSFRDLNLYLGGLNFRLRQAVVLKAEFSRATDSDIQVRDGWQASLAVLF